MTHRVLIVDEHERRRTIHAEWLTRMGATVVMAHDPASVLTELHRAAVDNSPFTLILIDGPSFHGDGWALVEAIRHDETFAQCPVVVQIPAAPTPEAETCSALTNVHALTKPLAADTLRDLLMTSAHVSSVSLTPSRNEPVSSGLPCHILLAEDGEINQLVAIGILEMAGHAVDAVDNGRDVVSAWQAGHYDVILMDVEMPEMDGLEATRRIRQLERETNRPPTPIVAMTAHATQNFEQRCRGLGMDAFLTKPIASHELLHLLQELPRPSVKERTPASP